MEDTRLTGNGSGPGTAAIRIVWIVLVALLLGACTRPEPVTTEDQIHATFRELKRIRMMKPGEAYSVVVDGGTEAGPKEQFLRRRNAAEIWQSRLSTGCGDYAMAFIQRMKDYGVTTLMIDAAELSPRSLASRFAGHAVVAVRNQDEGAETWWLVDPSTRRVLSQDWDPAAKAFEANGKRFWIGFCGPVEDYPVQGPGGLRDFYDQTLNRLPADVLQGIGPGH